MDDQLVKEINDKLDVISVLNKYEIEFGVLQEDEFIPVKVNVLNPDETTSEVDMTIGDIMYFTEKGTITIPPRPILNDCLLWVNQQINRIIDKIVDGVFNGFWTEDRIDSEMFAFGLQIQDHARMLLENMIRSSTNLSSLLDQTDEKQFLYDLNKLKNHIKCKIIKK